MIEPLTPADCDLRDFAFMPLDVVRLRDSDLAIQVSGEEFRCAVLLWCAAWHQVPAASLPDDDTTLSALAGYGRAVQQWRVVRENALRGWVKCADGRLYHPVVAEKALDAWRAKLTQRWKTECARIKKHNQRHQTDHAVPDFEVWLSLGCPQGHALNVPRTDNASPEDKGSKSPGTGAGCPDSVPREMHSKGQGEGQGQGEIKEDEDRAGAQGDPEGYLPSPTACGKLAKLLRANGVQDANPGNPVLRAWAEKGLTEDEALAGLETARAARSAPSPMTWAYLARVLETQRLKAAESVPDKGATPAKPPQQDRWWITDAGIDRKARELGMFARGGETYAAFKDRIFAELRKRGEPSEEQPA